MKRKLIKCDIVPWLSNSEAMDIMISNFERDGLP